jgi:diamine N-acetyltransferase
MSYQVYIRPLNLDDAKISFKWRNNPLIWKYTKFKISETITESIETAWLKQVLNNSDEHRFAICLKENGRYLGNIQLIDVKDRSAQYHIFIGEASFWGLGIANEATKLILGYGFVNLGLDLISLEVHKENLIAQSVYKRMGFHPTGKENDFIKMSLSAKHYFEGKAKIQQQALNLSPDR